MQISGFTSSAWIDNRHVVRTLAVMIAVSLSRLYEPIAVKLKGFPNFRFARLQLGVGKSQSGLASAKRQIPSGASRTRNHMRRFP